MSEPIRRRRRRTTDSPKIDTSTTVPTETPAPLPTALETQSDNTPLNTPPVAEPGTSRQIIIDCIRSQLQDSEYH